MQVKLTVMDLQRMRSVNSFLDDVLVERGRALMEKRPDPYPGKNGMALMRAEAQRRWENRMVEN